MFTQSHRDTRNLEFEQSFCCKFNEAIQTFMKVALLRKMTVKKSCVVHMDRLSIYSLLNEATQMFMIVDFVR